MSFLCARRPTAVASLCFALAILGPGPRAFAADNDACEVKYNLLTRALAALFKKKPAVERDYAPILHPPEVRAVDVIREDERQRKELAEWGVGFERLPSGRTYLQSNYEKQITKVIPSDKPEENIGPVTGSLLRITRLPKPDRSGNFFTPALFHPQMAEYLAHIQAAGYQLVVDTSLHATGAGAFLRTEEIIGIQPNTPWGFFVHEFEHLQTRLHVEPHLPAMVKLRKTNLLKTLPPAIVQEVGAARVKAIQKLFQLGIYSWPSINEKLSVNAELRALGLGSSYVNQHGPRASLYALRYQISELKNLASRTASQERSLKSLESRYAWVERYQRGLAHKKAVGIGGVVSTAAGIGTVATIRALTHPSLSPAEPRTISAQGHTYQTNSTGDFWDCLDCSADDPLLVGFEDISVQPNGQVVGTRILGDKVTLGYVGYTKLWRNLKNELWGQRNDGADVFLEPADYPDGYR